MKSEIERLIAIKDATEIHAGPLLGESANLIREMVYAMAESVPSFTAEDVPPYIERMLSAQSAGAAQRETAASAKPAVELLGL